VTANSVPNRFWDGEFAASLIDAIVVVAVDLIRRDGSIVEHQDFWGQIVKADETYGFVVELAGVRTGEEYKLPPDTTAFKKISRGRYTVQSTGETVIDPDYACGWTLLAPNDD
jgi:hypothetical protein